MLGFPHKSQIQTHTHAHMYTDTHARSHALSLPLALLYLLPLSVPLPLPLALSPSLPSFFLGSSRNSKGWYKEVLRIAQLALKIGQRWRLSMCSGKFWKVSPPHQTLSSSICLVLSLEHFPSSL